MKSAGAALGLASLLWMGTAAAAQQPLRYALTADSLAQAAIPRGTLHGPFEFHSKTFAGTVRRYWVHVPAGYDPKRPPNLLVFQDGQRHQC